MDSDRPAPRRVWAYVLVLGGIVGVTFSWLTPQPRTDEHRPPAGVDQQVYIKCAKRNATPTQTPDYGDRALDYECRAGD